MKFPQAFLIFMAMIATLPLKTLAQTQNIDDLPGIPVPDQLTTWVCEKNKSRIAIEVKNIQDWKTNFSKEGWECDQQTSDIAVGVSRLSCEPKDTIAILRIFWLKGDNGQQQLNLWRDSLTAEGMICTSGKVTPLGSEENAF